MDAEDAFGEPGVWRNLRRTLKNSILQIEAPQDPGFMPSSLKPTPIPIEVKVIVTGDYDLYYELYEGDPAFADTFLLRLPLPPELPNAGASGLSRDARRVQALLQLKQPVHLLVLQRRPPVGSISGL